MSGYLFYTPRYRPSSPTGGIYPNSTITVYLSQTTTLSPIYYDINLSTQLSNPILADTTGLFPAFFLNPGIIYRIILKDKNGVVVFDQDPFVVLNSPFGSALTSDSLGRVSVGVPTAPGTALTVQGGPANVGINVSGGITISGSPPVAAPSSVSLGGTTQTTVGAAGAATSLPATPSGYLQINVAGVPYVIPYYAFQ